MGLTLTEKILKAHLVEGEMVKGSEIGIRIDQTLTQDATGTMAYLEFEAMGVPRVRTERSVAYIDHNTLQNGFENADDHRFIGSVAKKHGIYFSRPGNGICHQVHLERFGVPGKTLIGSDSHTPTGGGIGMIAMGAGGLDVAVAMGGGTYYITCPKVVKVELTGKLSPWVAAKDVILEVLRRMSVKGGVGKVIEYCGEGVKTLSVPERATITNMGAELGATTSIFPSDEVTKQFLEAQGRGEVWSEQKADPDAVYDEELHIDLSELVPLAACPHSPDNVKTVAEIGKLKIDGATIITIVLGVIIMVALQLFVTYTKQGKAMRAVSEDKEASILMGINVNSTITLTFAIGSGLAAVASLMYCVSYPQVSPMMGAMLGLKAFVAAVLGGIGSIPGAMVGGLVIGVVESLTKAYIGTITGGVITSAFSDAIVFGILIIVLLVKPSGLMGEPETEKV